MSSGGPAPEPEVVSRAVVAAALGVTDRTLQRWERDDGLGEARTDDRSAAYHLPTLLLWLLQRGDEASPLQMARVREIEARAAKRELEIAQARGELVPRSDVMALVEAPIQAVDRELKASPARMARNWAKRLDVTEAIAIELIEEMVEEIRSAMRELVADADDAAA